eukprot:TRINITY_DN6100_c0_g2_i4.p1 TRINITY_DN6100_c0_g2~~TRINITY_DN6100_c0_g2_i4.p1  ORF type:complete len:441 (+),score=91.35 TRINITY_DN6100_c0_g2_i4:403-1725(+)
MDLGAVAFPDLYNAVNKGKISEQVVDRSVRHALYAKFAAGLFDQPYANPLGSSILDNPTHRALARTVAQESIVLLKNDNDLLPMDITKLRSVAIIGPNGNAPENQIGGYTQEGAHVVTPLEGISNYASQHGVTVRYAQGCFIMNNSLSILDQAVTLASQSDAVILVVGDNQDTCQESWGGRTGDRTDLDLPGGQLDLVEAILKTGKPTVVVLINGRPATFGTKNKNSLLNSIQALLVAWRCGEEGGNALADIIFGNTSPSGKLISSWPFSVGQIGGPAQPYYTKYRQYDGRTYTFEPSTPLFPFGFGLSYTTFRYSGLSISPSQINSNQSVTIRVTVQNTGKKTGGEVVQLYVADVLASVVRYKKQLFGFQKIFLEPGQQTVVTFSLAASELAFYNSYMQLVVEPGQFDVWVGPDCQSGLSSSFQVLANAANVLQEESVY